MRAQFVETENTARFQDALSAMQQRGADEACVIVVDGVPGLGKTTTLKHWAARNACVYLRAKREWTPNWFMKELLESMRVSAPHSFQAKYETALKELGLRQNQAGYSDQVFAIVVDEADHVSRRADIMETIRDLSDMLEVPCVLVGMGKIRDNLVRFPQIASRISQYIRFEKAGEHDVRRLLDGLCEVAVGDDLMKFTLKVTGGFNREIKEAIANIERFGFRNPPKDEQGLTLADMAGQILVNDRRNGQPIKVPERNL